ncbi:hypothetical protein Tharo_3362 [Thauera aromatica K172]|uniref:Uncharacterized protein n=1 Tax=Thauera aromatica K172 TaxID=44139 RepID=A0A2R4BSP4_THAAR|nr:hypothetical protein Tharo_3362 [Thauera aromatica K172]
MRIGLRSAAVQPVACTLDGDHPPGACRPALSGACPAERGVEDLALEGASFDHPGWEALPVPHRGCRPGAASPGQGGFR